jgi:hypothetical protein
VIPVAPDSLSSSSTEPTHTIFKNCVNRETTGFYIIHTSSRSSLAHRGIGVPQYRFLEIFQSRAFASQFPNLLSPTLCGTLEPFKDDQTGNEDYTADRYEPPRTCIVINKFVHNRGHSNKPRWDGAVDQRCPRPAD